MPSISVVEPTRPLAYGQQAPTTERAGGFLDVHGCYGLTADGLRLANYTHARLGPIGRDDMVDDEAPDGTVVRSFCHVAPVMAGDRIDVVTTNFYGDDHPRVKLKMDRVVGSDEWRERPHWVRPAMIDMELFYDYLTRVRPQNLAAQGLIESASAYDLEADCSERHDDLLRAAAEAVQEGNRPGPAVTYAAAEMRTDRKETDGKAARGRRIKSWLRRLIEAVRRWWRRDRQLSPG